MNIILLNQIYRIPRSEARQHNKEIHERYFLSKIKNIYFIYCVVPENIHTPPTEGHGNSKG